MEFTKQIERLQLLNKLIREQKTGSPEELANRLGVSRRQLYVYLEYLKDCGIEIQFYRKLNSFVYTCQKQIYIDWRFEVLDSADLKKVVGGEGVFFGLSMLYQNNMSVSLVKASF